MEKKRAVKFYIPPQLMETCERIFEEQGVDLSEGMARLVRALVEFDKEFRPVLLMQSPGDSSRAIAELILKRKTLKLAGKRLK